ncbi:MAG TPA: glycosyltransferase [Gaiellaceae bacterium]|nr:glycosyltransferase [Gaiellaceae bacterium]
MLSWRRRGTSIPRLRGSARRRDTEPADPLLEERKGLELMESLMKLQALNGSQRSTRSAVEGDGRRDAAAVGDGGRRDNGSTTYLITIVVPTKNEAGNIEPLVERLHRALPSDAEIIFVDDSTDETPAAIERARRRYGADVRLIHRKPDERVGGLGGAVVAGLRAARAPWVCVMDADLQHPPVRVLNLLERALHGDVDLVVASRYRAGGSTGSFGRARGAVSRLSNLSARALFPVRLRRVTDPMSGFFIVRKHALDLDGLSPRGFKILLEILARTRGLRVAEIPFKFGERFAGESKAALREGLVYLSQLVRLRLGEMPFLFTRFGLVGASGIVVNMLVFAALYAAGLHYLAAAVLATQGSTLWLYVLTDRWVFSERAKSRSAGSRMAMYFAMNNAGFALRGPLLVLLIGGLGLDPLLGNLASLVALTLVRFAVADSWIWKDVGGGQCRAATHAYDVHGLVTVESDVPLPELERFRVSALRRRPNIRVRIGALSRAQSELVSGLAFAARHIRYDEGLGRFGFAVDISIGRRTEIVASPLLRASPHVLYTNVVEPVLRWTFVRKGYALVHAACISFGGEAVLVTAQTDTGKTTTILKVLDAYRCAFVSDDLTLIAPDGRVLTYPKPLTVSCHTVGAVRAPTLSRLERLGLPLQSRIHSRSGRRYGLLLTRTRLPVATINALVQLLVPPPKYHVEQLVPGVECATTARLARLIVIQRGPDATVARDGPEAVETLLSNCEDAYSFPPYPTIAGFLHGSGASDLHDVERSIVTSALAGVPTTLLCSETMDWWRRLPSVVGAAAERHVTRPQEVVGSAVGLRLGI